MIGRVPRHRHSSDDVPPIAFHVFIPGAIASGFLVSVAMLVADVFGRIRGDRGSRRKIELSGAALAAEVRYGYGAAQHDSVGLRRRATYGLVGSAALALVVAGVPGATWNFLNPGGYLSNIAWIWAICMLTVFGVVVLAVQALRLAPEWVPFAAALVGAGVALRFVMGPEAGVVRSVIIVVAIGLTLVAVASTWHLRYQRGVVRVPGSVRPMLTSTPLGRTTRVERTGSRHPLRRRGPHVDAPH